MIHAFVRAKAPEDGVIVKEMLTGERLNVIAGEAKALLMGDETLAARVAACAAETGLEYTAEVTADGVLVTAHGIPGHSAYPEGRRSAIVMMLKLFRYLGATGSLLQLCNAMESGWDGAGLGCACEDELSGHLTCNMGILHIQHGEIYASLDMRCPVTADLALLEKNARAALSGFTFEDVGVTEPHHVPADSELVTCLLDAYHEETGLPAEACSTGGGTYAKVLKQGVAFGASFPDDEDVAHQANEYIYISKLMKSAKVYANALLRLCAE